ncbi:MAG TPA: N-acetylmuramoyl-L-alanine amidase [Oceanithermus profundus]|uniref:N-acetylmuramoyl-L-alanine amidase n=1 Tax=Oceanithermus profundus TaxID=187137 RepID=A0A7C5WWU5_9DEIN|nr:N-acetylmuramoyl-L-alanine amidase [Oceanithermus profundus]
MPLLPYFLQQVLEDRFRPIRRVDLATSRKVLRQIAPTWSGGRRRPLRAINRIIVHQTGIEFGVNDKQVKRAGSIAEAHRRRFLKVKYHYVVTTAGEALQIHPLERHTYHAGKRANRWTVGVAFEGRFPRFERERADRHTKLTSFMLDVYSSAFTSILEDIHLILRTAEPGMAEGLPVSTHRQISKNRKADPGELLMQRVVIPAIPRTPAALDLDWVVGSGSKAPKEWRPGWEA